MATNSTTASSVVKNFLNELNSLRIELDARRRFQEDVVAYIRDRNLTDDFNKYRAELHAPRVQSPEIVVTEDHDDGDSDRGKISY